MIDSAENISSIPPIGSSQIGLNSNGTKKPDVSLFDNAPNDVTFGSFFGKFIIGGIVGVCVAALLLGTLSIGGITNTDDGTANSLLPIILPIIGFVVGLVGNVALAGLYNLFFNKRYYNFGKMFGLIFASSLIIFLFFFLIYFLFMNKGIIQLYTVLGFQIIFGLYISINLMDFLSQPNYSASSLMGNTLGCVLSVVVFLGIIQALTNGNADLSKITLPIVFSGVAAYAVMIFGAGIWDAIYYKFYEWGNNPFYLPSMNELREDRQKEETQKAKEEQDVNVDIK